MNDLSEPGVLLIPATPDDAEAISAMATRIWPDAYGSILTREQIAYMLGKMYEPSHLRREMCDEGIVYLWIVRGGERVGFFAFGPVRTGAACPLHKCYILPEIQSQGVGSSAMELLLKRLAAEKVTSLDLRVNRRNAAAIAFYRKHGFTTQAEDCREIGGGFVMDDYLMSRDLG